jgi:hypothetical protein
VNALTKRSISFQTMFHGSENVLFIATVHFIFMIVFCWRTVGTWNVLFTQPIYVGSPRRPELCMCREIESRHVVGFKTFVGSQRDWSHGSWDRIPQGNRVVASFLQKRKFFRFHFLQARERHLTGPRHGWMPTYIVRLEPSYEESHSVLLGA